MKKAAEAPAASTGTVDAGAVESSSRVARRRANVRRLLEQGLRPAQVADILDVPAHTVTNDRRVLMLPPLPVGRPSSASAPAPRPCEACGDVFVPEERTSPGRACSENCRRELLRRRNRAARKHPAPEPINCARCGSRFEPRAADVAPGRQRKFCPGCYHESLRIYPRPSPRECPTCKLFFVPEGWEVARGAGIYCSDECYRCSEQLRTRACAQLRAMWANGESGARKLIERANGRARRTWKLRWAPKPGRPRNDARPDFGEALDKIRAAYEENAYPSERELQRLTGESRRVIRIALGRPV